MENSKSVFDLLVEFARERGILKGEKSKKESCLFVAEASGAAPSVSEGLEGQSPFSGVAPTASEARGGQCLKPRSVKG